MKCEKIERLDLLSNVFGDLFCRQDVGSTFTSLRLKKCSVNLAVGNR